MAVAGQAGPPVGSLTLTTTPSTTASSDLDGDDACHFHSYINSTDRTSPPQGLNTWRTWCGSSWSNREITILQLPPSPPTLPPSPPSPPQPPQPPPPPSQPTTTFDVSTATMSIGWSNGGDDPPYAFSHPTEGSARSLSTGPSAGVDGSGSYFYAEASSPRVAGDLFTLAYNGSVCADIGLGVSTVAFYYHMYGSSMGTLRLTNAAREMVWSRNGDLVNEWHFESVGLYSSSFVFEYTCGDGWAGDAALAQVAVSCGAAPPHPPSSPPHPPSSTPLPPSSPPLPPPLPPSPPSPPSPPPPPSTTTFDFSQYSRLSVCLSVSYLSLPEEREFINFHPC